MLSIWDRLLVVEDDFIRALAQGEEAVASFEERWEALMKDVDEIATETGLAAETATLVYTTASRIAVLAEASTDIYTNFDDLTTHLVDDLDSLVSELSIHDSSMTTVPPPLDTRQPRLEVQLHPVPETTVSKKRRRCCIGDDGRHDTRKRQRAPSRPQNLEVANTGPPSPVSSVSSPDPEPAPMPMSMATPKRKRRLSEAVLEPWLHPAKRLYAGPRLHAVSDSFVALRAPSSAVDTLSPCRVDTAKSQERDATTVDSDTFITFDIQPLYSSSWSLTSSSEASFGSCFNEVSLTPPISLDVGGFNDFIDPLVNTDDTVYNPPIPHLGRRDGVVESDAGIPPVWFSFSSPLTASPSPSSSSCSSPILTPNSLSPITTPFLELVSPDQTDSCRFESPSDMAPLSLRATLPDVGVLPYSASSFHWEKPGAARNLPVRVDGDVASDTFDLLLHWLSTTPLPGDPKLLFPTASNSLMTPDTPDSANPVSVRGVSL